MQNIRQSYKKIKDLALGNQALKIHESNIDAELMKIQEFVRSGSNDDKFLQLQECSQIKETYEKLKETIKEAKTNITTQAEYQSKIKKVFAMYPQKRSSTKKDEPSSSEIRSSEIVVNQEENRSLNGFFKKKEEQHSSKINKVSFRNILESREFDQIHDETHSRLSKASHSRNKSKIRRKEEEKSVQIQKLLEEHRKASERMVAQSHQQQELNQFQKNLLKEEKDRCMHRIEALENEIEQLYRDNYRLKEIEKSQKANESFAISVRDEKTHPYLPYAIKTRANDLNKINKKNEAKVQALYADQSQSEVNQYSANKFFQMYKSPKNGDLYSEKFPPTQNYLPSPSNNPIKSSSNYPKSYKEKEDDDNEILKDLLGDSFNRNKHEMSSMNRGNHFDTFQMANISNVLPQSELGESRQMAYIDSTTSTRNKVGFFKQSLVLVRNDDLEIAFKKSQLPASLDLVRFIFYINNKSNTRKALSISYEFQEEYFEFKVIEKLTAIQPNQQGRQVLEVRLVSKSDLNGVTDVHIKVDERVYDLWLPVSFIQFEKSKSYHMSNYQSEMTVVPDRQFSCFENVQKILPAMYGGRDGETQWAYLYGKSKFGAFTVKLTWINKELSIETSEKWIDFIGFVMHFFK